MNRAAETSTDRAELLKMWDESWDGGIWFGPWSLALAGLTPTQAAWQPQPGKHAIWQIVAHVVFWREATFALLAGRPAPGADEVARLNFPAPAAVTEEAWRAVRARLEDSQRRMREAIADPAQPLERPRYHLVHDANHLGQILYLRSLLDLTPIEG